MSTSTEPTTLADFQISYTPLTKNNPKAWRNYPSTGLSETLFDRDVPVGMSDGVRIRVDVFRPKDGPEKLPAILMWSPYGKSGVGSFGLHVVPGQAGIPNSALSGLEKFEGLDPAEFCPRGYVVVNADARGVYDSEGDMVWSGVAEGKDCAETVEWIASQPWCTGKVGMGGNSWLALTMWHCAALKPKGLACIAPWEGFSDLYRETMCRGGIPHIAFSKLIAGSFEGRGKREDPFAMLEKYPYVNAYWDDKRAKLRIHPTHEWHDLYQPEAINDLTLFYDRFLKDHQNNWDVQTAKVRLSLLRMNGDPIVNQPETDYPIPRTEYRKLTLLPDGKLSENEVQEGKVEFDGRVMGDEGEAKFEWKFKETTKLAGYAKVVLHMSTDKGEDFDVFTQLRKADKDGKLLDQINIPFEKLKAAGAPFPDEASVPHENIFRHRGPKGALRASHRAVSASQSTDFDPFHNHTASSLLPVKPNEIVQLEIGFWPMGIVFEEGERLVLVVSGREVCLPEFTGLEDEVWNQGRLSVHMGGEFGSFLQVPVI